MTYKILIKKSALRTLSRFPADVVLHISKKIDFLKENPRPSGCKKLKSTDNHYRIRVGDYRIVYTIFDDILLIEIVKIGNRRDIYR